MHRESHLPTIDPSLLDLKAHRTSSDYIPITPYAVDDVAIATGQAGYDEVNDQQLWTIPNNASCFVDDFELAANRKLRYG